MEMPAAPVDGNRFFFNLRVPLLGFREGTTCVGNWGPPPVQLQLGEYGSQSPRASFHDQLRFLSGSKYLRVVSSDSDFLVSLNAAYCSGPHTHGLDVLVSSLSGPVRVVRFFMKRLQYVIMPRKLRTPVTVVGAGAVWMSRTLAGSGATPSAANR